MTLQIFSACVSESEPPKTVKSWLKTYTGRPSISAVPGDHAVAEDLLLLHAEVGAAVRHEAVELDERALVEQQVDALARGQLALLVLRGDALRAAAQQGGRAHALQALEGRLLHASGCVGLAGSRSGADPTPRR